MGRNLYTANTPICVFGTSSWPIRKIRGYAYAAQGRVRRTRKHWIVEGRKGDYIVTKTSCNCPDDVRPCKHMYAVQALTDKSVYLPAFRHEG